MNITFVAELERSSFGDVLRYKFIVHFRSVLGSVMAQYTREITGTWVMVDKHVPATGVV